MARIAHLSDDDSNGSKRIKNPKKYSVGDYVWTMNDNTVEPFPNKMVSTSEEESEYSSQASTITEDDVGGCIGACNAPSHRNYRSINKAGCALAAQAAAMSCEQGKTSCKEQSSDTFESLFDFVNSTACGNRNSVSDERDNESRRSRSRSRRSSSSSRKKVSSKTLLNLRTNSVMEKSRNSRSEVSDNESERRLYKGSSNNRNNRHKDLNSKSSASTTTSRKTNRGRHHQSSNRRMDEQEIIDDARRQASDIAAKVSKVVEEARVQCIERIEREMDEAKTQILEAEQEKGTTFMPRSKLAESKSKQQLNPVADNLLVQIEKERQRHLAMIEQEMERAKRQIMAEHGGTCDSTSTGSDERKKGGKIESAPKKSATILEEIENEQQKQRAIAARIEKEIAQARQDCIEHSVHRRKICADWIEQELEEAAEKKRMEEDAKRKALEVARKEDEAEEDTRLLEEASEKVAEMEARRMAEEREARMQAEEEERMQKEQEAARLQAALEDRFEADLEIRLAADEQKRLDAEKLDRQIKQAAQQTMIEEIQKKAAEVARKQEEQEKIEAERLEAELAQRQAQEEAGRKRDIEDSGCDTKEEDESDEIKSQETIDSISEGGGLLSVATASVTTMSRTRDIIHKCTNTIANTLERTVSSTLESLTMSFSAESEPDGRDFLVCSRNSTISSIGDCISSDPSGISQTQDLSTAEIMDFFTQLLNELSRLTQGERVPVIKGFYFLACLLFYLFWPENLRRKEFNSAGEMPIVVEEQEPVKRISLLDLALE